VITSRGKQLRFDRRRRQRIAGVLTRRAYCQLALGRRNEANGSHLPMAKAILRTRGIALAIGLLNQSVDLGSHDEIILVQPFDLLRLQ
jgi:hypothetical protein